MRLTDRRTAPRSRQRGAISVETALVMPLIAVVIIGGVHLGMVLMTRHKLSDATSYAARAAVISKATGAGVIRARILDRMGANSSCADVVVTAATNTDGTVQRLDVSAVCKLKPGIGGDLIGAVGPDQVSVAVSLPL
jgi:Flp pilus assembly protein TadG